MRPPACDKHAVHGGQVHCKQQTETSYQELLLPLLHSRAALHGSCLLLLAQQLPWQFIQAEMRRLEGPGEATQPSPAPQPRARPCCAPFSGEKRGIPPHEARALRAECDGEAGRGWGELAIHPEWEGTLGRASSPPEHRRPGLTRRVLPRHPYTPWVPPTAWDRYSWSGGACPIMPSCHGALQAPPLPAAAAVPEHSSGEGWLLPATPCTPGAALFPAVAPLSVLPADRGGRCLL